MPSNLRQPSRKGKTPGRPCFAAVCPQETQDVASGKLKKDRALVLSVGTSESEMEFEPSKANVLKRMYRIKIIVSGGLRRSVDSERGGWKRRSKNERYDVGQSLGDWGAVLAPRLIFARTRYTLLQVPISMYPHTSCTRIFFLILIYLHCAWPTSRCVRPTSISLLEEW